ncbi:MAG: hypothetical protein K6B46_06190 [Opitutales bacterium]|nr:hypothetical protein [Opitutales bacterium]
MKKILQMMIVAFAVLFMAGTLTAAPEKKSAKPVKLELASAWIKKAKQYEGKTVSTLVANVEDPGEMMSNAPAVAILIESATAKKSGGQIYILIPGSDASAFQENYMPKKQDGGSKAFGARKEKQTITGVFTTHKGVPVLLVNLKKSALDKLPSVAELYAAQGGEGAEEAE